MLESISVFKHELRDRMTELRRTLALYNSVQVCKSDILRMCIESAYV